MLNCDESGDAPAWSDQQIAEAFATTTRSIENWRKQAAQRGPLSLLERKQRDTPPTALLLDGEKEAQLTKIVCSTPPDGRSRWTLQMLADKLVAMEVVGSISPNTVGRVQKNELKPWLKSMWCIPPEQDSAFVAAMEQVLTVYQRPYDALFSVVNMDEQPIQFVSHSQIPLPVRPGDTAKVDYEYVREGMCNAFMFVEPLGRWAAGPLACSAREQDEDRIGLGEVREMVGRSSSFCGCQANYACV